MSKFKIEEIPAEKFSLPDSLFQQVQFQGKNINVFRHGVQNGQKLLFIHGFNYFVKMYSTIINELMNHFDVLAMDLPGHGLSDAFDHYDMDLQLNCIKHICDQQHFKDFVVTGHSMGGMLSVAIFQSELFKPLNIIKCIGLAPAGIATNLTIGSILTLLSLKMSSSEEELFQKCYNRLEKLAEQKFSKYKDILIDYFYSVVSTDKAKYVRRQHIMLSSMPWKKGQQFYLNADSKNVKLIFYSHDETVHTKKSYNFISENLKHAQLVIENGHHESCILNPKYVLGEILKMTE